MLSWGNFYAKEPHTPCPKISDTPRFKDTWFSLWFMDFNEISYTALRHFHYDVFILPCVLSVTSL